MKTEKEIKERIRNLEDSLKFVMTDMNRNKKKYPERKLQMWRDAIWKIVSQLDELEWILK